MESTKHTAVLIIYMGSRINTSDKIYQQYLNTETGEKLGFSKKLLGYESVGNGLTSIEKENGRWGDHKHAPAEGKAWREKDDNQDTVLNWSINHRAALL